MLTTILGLSAFRTVMTMIGRAGADRARVNQILLGKPKVTRFGLLDNRLKREIGYLTPGQRATSERLVKFFRFAVFTQAFEHGCQFVAKSGSGQLKGLAMSRLGFAPATRPAGPLERLTKVVHFLR